MKLSVGLPSYAGDGHAVPPSRLKRYARNAEAHGFAGAWTIEHLLRPPTYATSLLDPLATLATVAGATDTLPVGTSILILPLRNPVLVAKRAATIQHLAERRLTLGLGAGYVEAEFDAVGVPIEERGARLREGIELVSALLSGETVTFDGEFHSVEGVRLEPRLSQRPRILAGGGGVERDGERVVPDGVKRRLEHADGWIASSRSTEVVERDWAEIADYLDARGRDPDAADKVALQYLHLVPGDDADAVRRRQRKAFDGVLGEERPTEFAETHWLSGTVGEVLDRLAAYERAGYDEVILHPVDRAPGELDRQLRLWRDRLLAEYP